MAKNKNWFGFANYLPGLRLLRRLAKFWHFPKIWQVFLLFLWLTDVLLIQTQCDPGLCDQLLVLLECQSIFFSFFLHRHSYRSQKRVKKESQLLFFSLTLNLRRRGNGNIHCNIYRSSYTVQTGNTGCVNKGTSWIRLGRRKMADC